MPHASTLTRTSPRAGSGTSRSTSSRSPPGLLTWTAFILGILTFSLKASRCGGGRDGCYLNPGDVVVRVTGCGLRTEKTCVNYRGLSPGSFLGREFDLDGTALFVGNFEHLPIHESHEACNQVVGDLVNSSVVGRDVVIEELAAVRDSFLEFRDAVLQLKEVVARLELRIVLRHHEKAA